MVRLVQGSMLAAAWPGNALRAAQVPDTDSRIATASIEIETGFTGYLARPQGSAKYPGIIVMHDLQGLTPYIKDVTRRLAVEGFIALAPDFRTAASGGPNETPARELLKMNDVETSKAAMAAAAVLVSRAECSGKIGALGFGWGGMAANYLPLYDHSLDAAIGYYGLQPLYFQDDSYRAMETPVQMHFAGRDTLTNESIAIYETNLKDANQVFETFMYAGVGRGFDDDTNAQAYDKAASDLAWLRTMAFLNKHLK